MKGLMLGGLVGTGIGFMAGSGWGLWGSAELKQVRPPRDDIAVHHTIDVRSGEPLPLGTPVGRTLDTSEGRIPPQNLPEWPQPRLPDVVLIPTPERLGILP